MLLTLLTMVSFAETKTHAQRTVYTSEQDIDRKDLEKYSEKGLKALIGVFKACIERNETKDPEDVEFRLTYQKKRGGLTAKGKPYSKITAAEFLNILEEDTAEMKADIQDAEKELAKRKRGCKKCK